MKNFLTSLLLLILVCLCIFLSLEICFYSSEDDVGMSFISAFRNSRFYSAITSHDSAYSYPKESLAMPRKYVVSSSGTARTCIYNSDESYPRLNDAIRPVLKEWLSSDAHVLSQKTLTADEFRSFLSEDVTYIYVNYAVSYTPTLFSRIMGIPSGTRLSALQSVRDFFIMPDFEKYEKDVLEIFALDDTSGVVHQFRMKTELAATAFSAIANSSSVSEDRFCNFALDMNLDKPTAFGGNTPTTLLAPYVVILGSFETQPTYPVLESKNDFIHSLDTFNAIVSAFGYNPSSIRKRVYEDYTVFIENDSTLKLWNNGLIEYSAVGDAGLSLTDTTDTYEELNAAIGFTEKIWQIALPDRPFDASVTSNLTDASLRHLFTLDYYVGGVPVHIDIRDDDLAFAPIEHAASIELENGVLKSFRLFIRSYHETGEEHVMPSSFSAIDMAYAATAENVIPVTIGDLYICYAEEENSNLSSPSWAYTVFGKTYIIKELSYENNPD